jgi:hypothetical protein
VGALKLCFFAGEQGGAGGSLCFISVHSTLTWLLEYTLPFGHSCLSAEHLLSAENGTGLLI